MLCFFKEDSVNINNRGINAVNPMFRDLDYTAALAHLNNAGWARFVSVDHIDSQVVFKMGLTLANFAFTGVQTTYAQYAAIPLNANMPQNVLDFAILINKATAQVFGVTEYNVINQLRVLGVNLNGLGDNLVTAEHLINDLRFEAILNDHRVKAAISVEAALFKSKTRNNSASTDSFGSTMWKMMNVVLVVLSSNESIFGLINGFQDYYLNRFLRGMAPRLTNFEYDNLITLQARNFAALVPNVYENEDYASLYKTFTDKVLPKYKIVHGMSSLHIFRSSRATLVYLGKKPSASVFYNVVPLGNYDYITKPKLDARLSVIGKEIFELSTVLGPKWITKHLTELERVAPSFEEVPILLSDIPNQVLRLMIIDTSDVTFMDNGLIYTIMNTWRVNHNKYDADTDNGISDQWATFLRYSPEQAASNEFVLGSDITDGAYVHFINPNLGHCIHHVRLRYRVSTIGVVDPATRIRPVVITYDHEDYPASFSSKLGSTLNLFLSTAALTPLTAANVQTLLNGYGDQLQAFRLSIGDKFFEALMKALAHFTVTVRIPIGDKQDYIKDNVWYTNILRFALTSINDFCPIADFVSIFGASNGLTTIATIDFNHVNSSKIIELMSCLSNLIDFQFIN